jgi:hypothetical protein
MLSGNLSGKTHPDGTYVPVGFFVSGEAFCSLPSLSQIDDDFEVGEVPLDEILADLLHRDSLRLHRFGNGNRFFDLIEAGACAATQLLGAKRRHVDIEEAAFDRRGLFVNDGRVFGRGFGSRRVHLRDFSF